ncbi:DUF2312 domain-containing protein [Stappia sp. F7233]|uniref:DUF2312 domain-containing protein n=1 Tax=Stappia albiluteola TaxID=2758565 RepID=A0A839AIK3_9HYPH|nr:DUF2312 domain-containing protein [Stappia albiluteola]
MHGQNTPASEHLRSFRDRIVRLEEEKKTIADDIKDVYAEAKSMGFDRKALRVVVRESMETATEREAREETEAVADIYRANLGMLGGTPLGNAARKRITEDSPPDDDDTEQSDIEQGGEMPQETIDEAREKGREAAREGRKVIENPYVADDPRRAAWDEGWCAENGSDGMGIPEAWRRKSKKPKKTPGDEGDEG